MDGLKLRSFAKINLGLLLLGKRVDGYHTIATVFQQIDLYDILTFSKSQYSIAITSDDPSIPTDEKNLAYRAFHLFQMEAGINEGLHIHIEKRIPVGAGLGGGSSNAAVTLMAANKLYDTQMSSRQLARLALRIGSDVPFFLLGGTALGEGRGEILTPLAWPVSWRALLVCPDFQVSTAEAYREAKIALTKEEKITTFRSLFTSYAPEKFKSSLKNELEDVIFQRHQSLRALKENLYDKNAFYASMSGSGSTVYGLFHGREQAEEAAAFFSKQQGMKTFLCSPVSISPFSEPLT